MCLYLRLEIVVGEKRALSLLSHKNQSSRLFSSVLDLFKNDIYSDLFFNGFIHTGTELAFNCPLI